MFLPSALTAALPPSLPPRFLQFDTVDRAKALPMHLGLESCKHSAFLLHSLSAAISDPRPGPSLSQEVAESFAAASISAEAGHPVKLLNLCRAWIFNAVSMRLSKGSLANPPPMLSKSASHLPGLCKHPTILGYTRLD